MRPKSRSFTTSDFLLAVETIPHLIYYNSMKKIFAAAIFAFFAACAFCAENEKDFDAFVRDAFKIKLEAKLKTTSQESLDWIAAERQKLLDSANGKVGGEATLALECLFAVEQFHYMREIDAKSSASKDFLMEQYNKVDAWNQGHPAESRSEWYNLASYEVVNTAMPYIKYSKKVAYAMEEKKVYGAMADSNCQKGLLYLDAGLWRAFAPAIAGGNEAKALEYFEKATKIGPSDYEKFFGFVYLSQMDFKRGDLNSCLARLDQADALLPGNVYIPFVRRLNKAGSDIFEYANDKEKAMAKIKKNGGSN